METGHGLVSSNRLVKPGIEPATPGLQGKWFIHYTTVAPVFQGLSCEWFITIDKTKRSTQHGTCHLLPSLHQKSK